MKLTDIMPQEKWVALQEELHEQFGLNADVMDAKGKRLFGNTWGNELCKAIREDAKGLGAICAPAGQVFTQMMQDGTPFHEECDAGMMRVSVPIVVNGEVLGAVGGCGLMPEDGEIDEFTVEMMSDVDPAAIPDMATGIATANEDRVQEIYTLIQGRIATALSAAADE